MKKRLSFIVILVLAVGYSLSAQVQHFTWQGVEREYIVRTPTGHSGLTPVMFFLHGLGGNITNYDQEFNFTQIAEEFGWVIVLPQAINQGLGAMWNAGLTASSIDDVGFLMALLDSLTVQYQLDPDSVFFAGISMGGFMTHRMAIEHGDRINACAPVSGLISNADASQTPVAPVRMLHIHGTGDNVVGYNGYSAAFGMNIGLGVDAILQYWENANGCNGEPTIGGVHRWYGDANQYDADYKEIIYEFFSGHSLPSGIPTHEKAHLQVWPNPTSGILNVQITDSDSPEIQVFDMYGKLVDIVETMSSSSETLQIDLSRFTNGVYFLRRGNGAVAKVVLER